MGAGGRVLDLTLLKVRSTVALATRHGSSAPRISRMVRTSPRRENEMRMHRKDFRGSCLCRPLTWVFFLFVGCLVPARAQVGANVGGVVGDSGGGTIAGATVTITNTSNGVSQALTTGPGGNYRAVNLQPAPYVITVATPPFWTARQLTIRSGARQSST